MRIEFTLLIDDGARYYKGYPGIFLADYADLLDWKGERDEPFWDKVAQHYYAHLNLELFIEPKPDSTIKDIEKIIAEQIGFNWHKLLRFHKKVCVLLDGEFICIEHSAMQLSVLSKHYHLSETLPVFWVFSNQAGEIWNEDGLRYYMNSRESGRHNEPHVHVDYKHEDSVSICLHDGRVLDGNIPSKALRKARKKILDNKQFLLECWNKMTDGLKVDINQYFKIIPLEF